MRWVFDSGSPVQSWLKQSMSLPERWVGFIRGRLYLLSGWARHRSNRFGLPAFSDGLSRDADHRRVRSDVVNDDGVGAHPRAVADLHRADDLRAGPDEDVVAEVRALAPLGPDGHLM